MEPDTVRNERLSTIRSLGTPRAFDTSDILLSMDEPVRAIGLVLSGQISACAFSENGQQTWIGCFVADDFIGHVAYFSKSLSAFEAVADMPGEIVWLKPATFQSLLDDDPDLAHLVQTDLASRLDVMTRRLIEAVTLSAPGRVCSELKRMAKPLGSDNNDWVIRPNPVFVDIGQRISSTRETVSRTVSRMCDLGILSRQVGAIVIHDMDRLEQNIR